MYEYTKPTRNFNKQPRNDVEEWAYAFAFVVAILFVLIGLFWPYS